MGNQLTGIVPSQIQPVENYLKSFPEYSKFEANLGSTRFFKVARVKHAEGSAVVKVFVIHDPSLPLDLYKKQLQEDYDKLNNTTNVLFFQKTAKTEKVAILSRQYVKHSLYDRLSTRPFLTEVEKKFLAYQLLLALQQCHERGVCHGDIKSENVMVTSWNWLLLTDFACFKPTYLTQDNPADFSYFFDTSRRRTCNIAPERFVASSLRHNDNAKLEDLDLQATMQVKAGELKPSMDMFSAGCVIIELFLDGKPPFDLAQLLSYSSGEYSPDLSKLQDHFIEMVKHMLQKEPEKRLSASEYLIQQRGKAFPEYFYSFLHPYMVKFASSPVLSADERITHLHNDLAAILAQLRQEPGADTDESLMIKASQLDQSSDHNLPLHFVDEEAIVLIIPLVTSCIHDLHFQNSKLAAVELLADLARRVPAAVVLDRIVPYLLYLVNDRDGAVRAQAVQTVTTCLADIKSVPLTDANIFPEYILPQMSHLASDPVILVRVEYARQMATLAQTALRFLDIVQTHLRGAESSSGEDVLSTDLSHFVQSYDVERNALISMIKQKVVALLSDSESLVKQTLLAGDNTARLCDFFGREKAADILVSHMITFLNDKTDWQLRASFYKAIVDVAAYIGPKRTHLLTSLLSQGLTDTEEFVIYQALLALTEMTHANLLDKPIQREFINEIQGLIVHPSLWIRQASLGFIAACGRSMNIADVHCRLLPALRGLLKREVLEVGNPQNLLDAAVPSIARCTYDVVLRSTNLDDFFNCLRKRNLLRNLARSGHDPDYDPLEGPLAHLFTKLQSEGMTEEVEDRLLIMEKFLLKLKHIKQQGKMDVPLSPSSHPVGCINLGELHILRRHASLVHSSESKSSSVENSQSSARKNLAKPPTALDSPTFQMNEDWKQMFGSENPALLSRKTVSTLSSSSVSSRQKTAAESGEHSTGSSLDSSTQTQGEMVNFSQLLSGSVNTHPPAKLKATCSLALRELLKHERALHEMSCADQDAIERDPLAGGHKITGAWRPKGILVAHLHEHRGAVNKIAVNDQHSFFATCSNDGTMKLFDCSRMGSKSVTNRSRATYNPQEGQVKSVAFSKNSQFLTAVCTSVNENTNRCSIQVFNLEAGASKNEPFLKKKLCPVEDGIALDMQYYDHGSQNLAIFTTTHNKLIAWDLRMPPHKEAWRLQQTLDSGLVTCFDVHPHHTWLVLGTSRGNHAIWDMRFHLPVSNIIHPNYHRVRKLLTHPTEAACFISSVQQNNEVTFWNPETASRKKTLWASSADTFNYNHSTKHSVNGMFYGRNEQSEFLLTGSSDKHIRFWDLTSPENSSFMTLPAAIPSQPQQNKFVEFRTKILQGVDVVYEHYLPTPSNKIDRDNNIKEAQGPPIGHHDIIMDINVCNPGQAYVISCSRDGVVKVWK